MLKSTRNNRKLLIGLLLAVATFAAYAGVLNHEFINYDDDVYVTENRQIQNGLTGEAVRWAFSSGYAGNWHPLTWMSHMLDVQLFGKNAWGHHLTSLLFHVVNSLLLFLVLNRMTAALWQSAFVAAVFALHPLHVESVAWIAERKDVLSTLFWLLTMWAYLRYVDQRKLQRYLLVLLFFALGLMAKPMLVTLPFVLLLLDYWPLRRYGAESERKANQHQRIAGSKSGKQIFFRLLKEKVPMILLAAGSSVVTFIVQQRGGAVYSMEVLPMGARIANALVSYWRYIGKMIWPSGLAVFYPHPGTSIPVWQFAAAGLGLLAVTALVVWKFRTRPFFVVGWFWYIGTLVPVIGLLQVGEQSMADRYTYIPLIGLFIIIAFGVPELLARWQVKKTALAVAGGGISAAFMFTTITQVGYWHESRTLFQHALEVTSGNWVAHLNLGLVLAKQEKTSDAISHYTESLRIKPNYAKTHNDLGAALGKQGNLTGATVHLQRAIQIDPSLADAHNNLGITYAIQGKTPEAMEQFREAVRLNPDQWDAHYNLGLVLERQGKFDDAIAQYSNALRIKSDYTEARVALERTRRLQRESQGKTLPQNP